MNKGPTNYDKNVCVYYHAEVKVCILTQLESKKSLIWIMYSTEKIDLSKMNVICILQNWGSCVDQVTLNTKYSSANVIFIVWHFYSVIG